VHWAGFGRKPSWVDRGVIVAFAWIKGRKSQKPQDSRYRDRITMARFKLLPEIFFRTGE
jgi:hypothetical protein